MLGIVLGIVSLACGQARATVLGESLLAALSVADPASYLPVIIRFNDRIDPRQFRQRDRSERRRALLHALQLHARQAHRTLAAELARSKGRQIRSLWLINGLALQLPPDAIRQLTGHPQVASITLDEALPLWHESVPGGVPVEWNLDAVHAPQVWASGYMGQGVVIASMDTGVDAAHPDIGSRWRGGSNSWFDPNGEHPLPADSDGHGTWTMGVLLGGDASGTAIGVAPGASWIAVKIFNDARVASLSAIHMGFQWLLDPDGDPLTDDVPDIVNNSWGFESSPNSCITEFETDIQMLRAAGIAVVFAAGNTGPAEASSVSPANNAGQLAVGATDNAFTLANFSARGPSACGNGQFPLLSAPGVGIRTSDRCFGPLCDYAIVSGTSFAAPHVAGVMALLLSAVPDATVDALESALTLTALDIGTIGPDNGYGHGLIDAEAALHELRCPSDSADYDGDGIVDVCDNCIQVANPEQRDSNSDGFGNVCDTDLDNDGITNTLDVGILKTRFLSSDADADFNGDGIVNSLDVSLLKAYFLAPPGPSGIAP